VVRLSPEDRRAALIAATLPLLRTQGLDVSTRQIAEAAGVAEGTIFRVFPDKTALICAALGQAFDPAPIVESLKNLPDVLDLRTKLQMAARIIGKRFSENLPLIMALHASGRAAAMMPGDAQQNIERIVGAVAWLLEPHRQHLRHPPETLASMFTSLIMIQQRLEKPIAAKDIVSVLLEGALRPEKKTEPACS
jgi:AcrR family transcriptional regulator